MFIAFKFQIEGTVYAPMVAKKKKTPMKFGRVH